jgi:Flp pilus assembly pilin Flp
MAKSNEIKVQNNDTTTLVRDQEGLSTVEYVIILFLIAIVGITAWKSFGDRVKGKVGNATGSIGQLGS